MKKILLALFLVGCGNSLPTDETTQWTVTLGNWETPTCEGTMTLSPAPSQDFVGQTDLVGTWNCGAFGHQASGQITADRRVFLNLESNPGNWNGVRGELDNDAIVGDIQFDDRTQPFMAVRQ